MSLEIFGQLIGVVACALSMNACLNRDDRYFKLTIVFACLLWALHNGIIGANVAAILSLITAARVVLSIDSQDRRYIPVFVTLYVGIAIFEGGGLIDWLPVIAAVIGTLSFFCFQGVALRMAHCIGVPLWIIHDLHYGSIGGVISQSFTLIFCIYTVCRLADIRPGAIANAVRGAGGRVFPRSVPA